MAIDDATDLMVTARRPPVVRTYPAIGTRPRVIAHARGHSAPFQSNFLPSVSWSENADASCGRSA
ncbi:hypothetical protein T492DRAFT_1056664 [Pavlovales sp. CCMP2436]|nr:hypothetical protein T492DRAFT_1056664 [Pavlovales sp. CCMP2436]